MLTPPVKSCVDAESAQAQGDEQSQACQHLQAQMIELVRVNEGLMRALAEQKRAQETQQERLRFLSHIVDNLPTAFQTMSVQDGYRVVQWNHGAQALYGLTAQEAMGRTVHDLWPQQDADRMHAADLELVAGGDDVAWDVLQSHRALDGEIEAYQCEKRYIHQSGRTVWVHLSCSLVRDADRRPVHFISQIQDITAHKLGRQD
jgi:PAS domain-containing protein